MNESGTREPDDTASGTIRTYYMLSAPQLYEKLCDVTHDLTDLYDHLAFLQSQELQQKMVTWLGDPEASIQARDRAASYAAGHITSEIYGVEGTIRALQMERALVERLIERVARATP